MPRVLNKKLDKIPADAVYIGRPGPWGNQWSHLNNTATGTIKVDTREEAVNEYRKWILSRPDKISKAKAELKGKDLVCWCAPQACHGDVLLEIANS